MKDKIFMILLGIIAVNLTIQTVKEGMSESKIDELFDIEEKTVLRHYWFGMMMWLNLALSKEERNSFDSSHNKRGYVNILSYARLFGSMDNVTFNRLSEKFN